MTISTAAVLVGELWLLLGILVFSFILSLLFTTPLFSILQRLKNILWMVLFLIIIQSVFTAGGQGIIVIRNVNLITSEGIVKGLQLVFKMMIILISSSIMASNTSREIVQGLIQWKIPYEIAFMVSIAIRFLPMLSEEINDVVTAIQLRGIELERVPLKKRVRVYSYVLMPIVANSLIKAQRLSTAMELRAFGVYEKRTSYHVLHMGSMDYIIITSAILLLVLILGLNYFVF